MKKYLTFNRFAARVAFGLTMIFALTATSFAQVKLRNALDYDGDGKADYGVFRGSDSTRYFNKSGGTSLFQQFGSSNYDTLTPGDYDGDGKTDVSIWRETDGNFCVLRSTDNNLGVISWGFISDLPIAGYDAH